MKPKKFSFLLNSPFLKVEFNIPLSCKPRKMWIQHLTLGPLILKRLNYYFKIFRKNIPVFTICSSLCGHNKTNVFNKKLGY